MSIKLVMDVFFFISPGTILDHLVGEDIIADYLLYSLNRLEKFRCEFFCLTMILVLSRFCLPHYNNLFSLCALHRYVEKYDLQEPSDNIQHILKRIAVKLGKTQRVKAITGVGKKVFIEEKTDFYLCQYRNH